MSSSVAIDTAPELVQPATELSSDDANFLSALGRRVRALRDQNGMSRKLLAQQSKVSERYLGLLEAGDGNISVMLLRRIAAALSVSLPDLLTPEQPGAALRRRIGRFLEQLPVQQLDAMIDRLTSEFGQDQRARRQRIALIGLRGAGKSTLGAMLAKALSAPLIELNREVARETGLPVGEVMALYGQSGYRRIERKVFERVIVENDRAIVVAGGGVVADDEAFNLLLANCYTVWLKAQPEEHMSRVLAQGDLRPMAGNAGNDEAMQDLKRILDAREASYRRADAIVDTSGETPEASFARLRDAIAGEPIH